LREELISSVISSILPSVILEPKPPEREGQRNPRAAVPNPASPKLKKATMPRLRN
jgi:hypothetical protein